MGIWPIVLEVHELKQVYIASPFRGDYEKNIKNTVEYCKLASECGVIGLAPHLIFSQWCDDRIPEQRKKALKLGLALLEKCEELWVMGTAISQGMEGEIAFARAQGIPIFFVEYPMRKELYPVSVDENRLLNEQDVLEGSEQGDYTGKQVILHYRVLKPEYRVSYNQLWTAQHGPGCRPGRFSDTVHLRSALDGEYMIVGRGDLLGIPKRETLDMLKTAYSNLGQGYSERIDEEPCL